MARGHMSANRPQKKSLCASHGVTDEEGWVPLTHFWNFLARSGSSTGLLSSGTINEICFADANTTWKQLDWDWELGCAGWKGPRARAGGSRDVHAGPSDRPPGRPAGVWALPSCSG